MFLLLYLKQTLYNAFLVVIFKVYDEKLGKKSDLYVLKKGRKHGEEVKTSKDFIG